MKKSWGNHSSKRAPKAAVPRQGRRSYPTEIVPKTENALDAFLTS